MRILARVLLFVQGAMCVVYGLVVAFNLDALAAYMGLAIVSGDGRAEMLTMYLGLSSALGLYMLFAALSGRRVYEALLILCLSMLGITLGRLLGWLLFNTGDYILSSLAFDVPMIVLSVWCYWRLQFAALDQHSKAADA